ncbi:hypothetical protein ACX0HA_08655 [Flavobacterium hauense]
MKIFRRLMFLAAISFVIALGLFFINSNIIVKSSFADKLGEIVFMTIPVFIIVSLVYFANRALVRSVKGLKNKKPSQGEGSNR